MRTSQALAFAVLMAHSSGVLASDAVEAPTTARFEIDPVSEIAVFGVTAGFALLSEMIIRTGELRPQTPVDPDSLLGIDRPVAMAEDVEFSGKRLSDLTAVLTVSYALFDSIRAGVNGDADSWDTYLTLYTETVVTNWALVNLAKIAFRRPRPIAYHELRETGQVSDETNTALSFYSGHTALVAGISSTATYLAFTRDASLLEKLLTIGIGSLMTTYVAIQRIRVRAHFPTDVIAGAMVGAGVGVLVPHLHRVADDDASGTGVQVGVSADPGHQGLSLTGRF